MAKLVRAAISAKATLGDGNLHELRRQ